MATKADFTEDEWKALHKGVMGAGMLVSVSDPDFTDSFGEASALAKYVAEQRQKSESELVRELAGVHGSGFGLTASQQKVEAETVESLHVAAQALAEKAPDETDAYKEFVLGAADHVANAKGGLKPNETAAIDRLKEALG
ncbi:MAG: hypothetical protein C5B48_12685 [Candidatus Rokuibacteriota bacterium]|nr:MAG: hypothetical protein C5B48_12685 [Candidatus Rokubacteria bacterium]